MKEEWRPCPGFEDTYTVSSEGRVRRVAPGRNTHVGRVLTGGCDKDGYRRFVLSRNGERAYATARVLVCEAFHGPRPAGHEVNHKNGRKDDDRTKNLEWVTRSENCLHRSRVLGKVRRGAQTGLAKLTEDDVRALRQRAAKGESQRALSRVFGVAQSNVSMIVSGKAWSHVT